MKLFLKKNELKFKTTLPREFFLLKFESVNKGICDHSSILGESLESLIKIFKDSLDILGRKRGLSSVCKGKSQFFIF